MPPPPVEATVPAGTLLHHISLEIYRGQPLHFGKGMQHRFDDPASGYGVLYLAYSLATGLMESAFHKHGWWRPGAKRKIALSEVRRRMVRIVQMNGELTLCDLASENAAASAFGLNAAQLAVRRYRSTRALSAHIAGLTTRAGQPFDGILYPSRNNPGARCIALFDRAQGRVQVIDDIRLDDHRDWPTFVSQYGISTGKP